jgi:hypothetical protein
MRHELHFSSIAPAVDSRFREYALQAVVAVLEHADDTLHLTPICCIAG